MPLPRIIAAALVLIASLGVAAVRAQDDAPEDAPAAIPMTSPAEADGPDVYLLPDAGGRLRRVLGYRYEDFLQAWEAGAAGLGQAMRPPFSISKVAIDADADADDAAKIRATIEVSLQQEGWIETPLQLGSVIVSEMKIEDGAKGEYLTVDAARNSYVAWLRGKPGDVRTIVIEGQASVARDGESRRLELQLPSAAASTVRLTTPDGDVIVESPDDALVAAAPATENGRRTTQIEGARGRFVVRWGPKQSTDSPRFAAIEATVDALVDVSSESTNYEASFRINAFDRPVDRVRIRLPAGATASTTLHGGEYEVVSLGTTAVGEGPGDDRAVVEIRFPQPTANPPLVRLAAEQSSGAETAGRHVVELGAFEVIGAFRQHGAVAIRVSDQLYAHFEREGHVERIDPDELPEALASDAVTAAFTASDVDWQVSIHVQPRERRVRVTPQFDLHLGAQGAALGMVLDYQLTGGRTFELRVDLAEWELSEQPIESGGAIDLTQQHVTPEGELVLPLKDSTAEQVRVRLTLRREAGLGVHDLPLPVMLDALTLTGALTVTADDSWRATPDFQRSTGLAPASEAATKSNPNGESSGALAVDSPRQLPPLQLTTTAPAARLVVDVEMRERQIEARSMIAVRVEEHSVHVQQRLAFDIRHQPAVEIAATVASDLLANEELELLVDGKAATVDIQPITSSSAANDDARLRLLVRLPRPTQGRVELGIRSVHPLDEAQRTGAAALALPLAIPDQASASIAEIVAAGPLRVVPWPTGEMEMWTIETADASGAAAKAGGLRLRSTQPVDELLLRLEPVSVRQANDVRVDANWAQTWFAGGMRQDRQVFRFRATGSELHVQLPDGLGTELVETILDGVVVPAGRLPQGELVVSLPSGGETAAHTLELRTQRAEQLASWGRIEAGFARLTGNPVQSPAYWQVVLPPSGVALGSPGPLAGEYRIGWVGSRWGRQPTQSQADLEQWAGAMRAPAPAPSANVYLFSGFDLPERVEVAVVRRVWIIAAGALAALVIGLIWLHTAWGRSSTFWLAVGIGLAAVMAALPESALIVAQAAAVGAALTMLAAVTRRLVGDRRGVTLAPAAPTSSIMSRPATTAQWYAESKPSSSASIASAPSYRSSGSPP